MLFQSTKPSYAAASANIEAQPDPRGTPQQPLVVKPAAKSDEEVTNDKKQERERAHDRSFTQGVAVFAGFVALLQAGLFGYQIFVVNGQNRIFATQTKIMKGQKSASVNAAKAAAGTLATNQEIERAQLSVDCRNLLFLERKEVHDPKGLWLVGMIYYADRFGGYHQRGYGTRWDRTANRFVWDRSVRNLNYDRACSKEEAEKNAEN